MAKTMIDLANDALDVQDACNLSGVVHGFSRAVSVMRQDLGMDTPTCNENAITRMWLDKLNSLAGIQPLNDHDYNAKIHAAFEWARTVTGR